MNLLVRSAGISYGWKKRKNGKGLFRISTIYQNEIFLFKSEFFLFVVFPERLKVSRNLV